MGFLSRSKQNKPAGDDLSIDESEKVHAEPPEPEPEPIDTHAFVEDMRRKSEEIAMSVANRLAERMDGIVNPVHPPNETGTIAFFANPRAYSICNGSTKVILFVRPFENDFEYDMNPDLKLTPYQQSVRDTEEKMYKLDIKWFRMSLELGGSLSWNEFSNNIIKGDYDTVKNYKFTSFRECQW